MLPESQSKLVAEVDFLFSPSEKESARRLFGDFIAPSRPYFFISFTRGYITKDCRQNDSIQTIQSEAYHSYTSAEGKMNVIHSKACKTCMNRNTQIIIMRVKGDDDAY